MLAIGQDSIIQSLSFLSGKDVASFAQVCSSTNRLLKTKTSERLWRQLVMIEIPAVVKQLTSQSIIQQGQQQQAQEEKGHEDLESLQLEPKISSARDLFVSYHLQKFSNADAGVALKLGAIGSMRAPQTAEVTQKYGEHAVPVFEMMTHYLKKLIPTKHAPKILVITAPEKIAGQAKPQQNMNWNEIQMMYDSVKLCVGQLPKAFRFLVYSDPDNRDTNTRDFERKHWREVRSWCSLQGQGEQFIRINRKKHHFGLNHPCILLTNYKSCMSTTPWIIKRLQQNENAFLVLFALSKQVPHEIAMLPGVAVV